MPFKEISTQNTPNLSALGFSEFGIEIGYIHHEEVTRFEFLSVDLKDGRCPDQRTDGADAGCIVTFPCCFKAIFAFFGHIYQCAATTRVNQELAWFAVDFERGLSFKSTTATLSSLPL